jgi:hypothetical protein
MQMAALKSKVAMGNKLDPELEKQFQKQLAKPEAGKSEDGKSEAKPKEAGPNWKARLKNYDEDFTPVDGYEKQMPGITARYKELAKTHRPRSDSLQSIEIHEKMLQTMAQRDIAKPQPKVTVNGEVVQEGKPVTVGANKPLSAEPAKATPVTPVAKPVEPPKDDPTKPLKVFTKSGVKQMSAAELDKAVKDGTVSPFQAQDARSEWSMKEQNAGRSGLMTASTPGSGMADNKAKPAEKELSDEDKTKIKEAGDASYKRSYATAMRAMKAKGLDTDSEEAKRVAAASARVSAKDAESEATWQAKNPGKKPSLDIEGGMGTASAKTAGNNKVGELSRDNKENAQKPAAPVIINNNSSTGGNTAAPPVSMPRGGVRPSESAMEKYANRTSHFW